MYLIFSHGRSGTSELLRAVEASGSPVAWEPFKSRPDEPRARTKSDLDIQIGKLSGGCAKHLWTHLPANLNEHMLCHPAFSGKVVLYRKDVFAATMSLMVARQTKQWRKIKSDTHAGRIDPEKFEREMNKLGADQERYADHPAADVSVTYEELYGYEGDQEQAARSVLPLLGVPEQFIGKAISKYLTPSRKYKGEDYYRSTVTNYDELLALFQ